jgi:hypothetical protein
MDNSGPVSLAASTMTDPAGAKRSALRELAAAGLVTEESGQFSARVT